MPKLILLEEDAVARGGSLTVVTGCMPLASIINGDQCLTNDTLVPLMTRVVDKLEVLCLQGVEMGNKPVQWRPRHLNQIADAVVNRCMDSGTFVEWFAEQRSFPGLANQDVILMIDGGLRRSTQVGAAGWVIFVVQGGHPWKAGEGGVILPQCRSSFTAEAIALDEGMRQLSERWYHKEEGWLRAECAVWWESRRKIDRT